MDHFQLKKILNNKELHQYCVLVVVYRWCFFSVGTDDEFNDRNVQQNVTWKKTHKYVFIKSRLKKTLVVMKFVKKWKYFEIYNLS